MVQGENAAIDGAEEQMLSGDDNEKLNQKREEVKFIKGDHQNGDAKIDIGAINGKTFSGMTKEELMKFSKDPFWVRLRWFCFVAFWIIWLAMLIGAVLIIVNAPKCSAPQPLPWYKKGILASFQTFDVGDGDLENAEKLDAVGAIYELPSDLTYFVKKPDVEEKIKNIVNNYKESDVGVILDITPNFVTQDSELMKNAIADRQKRSAFIWIEKPDVPNNWLSIVNGSAWKEVEPGNFVLSQFGDNRFDLHMNDTIVKNALGDVLKHLIDLGVKGFRFKNTKFFLLTKNLQDEVPSSDFKYIHTQYGFWTHSQTTFQEGLGNVLNEYQLLLKNISSDAFISVADDILRPEAYKTATGELGVEIPLYGRFTQSLTEPDNNNNSIINLENELIRLMSEVQNNWLQWNFEEIVNKTHGDASAITLFMVLLPGVPVVPVKSEAFQNISKETYDYITRLRQSSSYKHGSFKMHSAGNLLAYSRIKSGNPGYFVIFNPSEEYRNGNFSTPELPNKMSVDFVSENYNVTDVATKSKVNIGSLEVSPRSAVVLTYVPIK